MASSGVILDSPGLCMNSGGFQYGILQAVFFQGEFCLALARIRIYAGPRASWRSVWTATTGDRDQSAPDDHSGCQLCAPSSPDVFQVAPRRAHWCSSLPV